MKRKFYVILLILLSIVACREDNKSSSTIKESDFTEWQNGEEVELTGTINPSKLTQYYLETEDDKTVHIISMDIDKLNLEAGTKLWIKGKIEYIHHEKPAGYREETTAINESTSVVSSSHSIHYPFTACYIKVSEYKILEPDK